ncbi:MAG: glycine cleavage system aminomethyltransferase GcvT [Gemmataceae bacterium]
MTQRTPLYDWHKAKGAQITEFGGWEMPVRYTSIGEEHNAVRTGVGLFDISHMGRLLFQGPDAGDFLQHIFTNDVESMSPGQVRYGLICNQEGGVLDDVLVYRLDTFWMMVVNASNREKINAWIEQHKSNYNVTVVDKTLDWGMLAIQGPEARKIAEGQAPAAAKLKNYYATTRMTQPGHMRIWSRTGYTGELGWEIVVANEEVQPLVELLVNTVAPEQGVELIPCGLGARDTLRLEAGMPLYGHELSEEIDPFQAGLGWAVKLNKGEFIGKTALEKHDNNTGKPHRVGLEIEGKRIAREGAKVLHNGTEVGHVTSGTLSPTLEKVIAMAFVTPDAAHLDTECEVDVRGKLSPAKVIPLPFYSRKKK